MTPQFNSIVIHPPLSSSARTSRFLISLFLPSPSTSTSSAPFSPSILAEEVASSHSHHWLDTRSNSRLLLSQPKHPCGRVRFPLSHLSRLTSPDLRTSGYRNPISLTV